MLDPEPDYRMHHRAPMRDDEEHTTVALADIGNRTVFSADVLQHPDWYDAEHAETIRQIRAAAGHPDARVTVYRAVPAGVGQINRGDWVALSHEYAQRHSYDLEGPGVDGTVIASEVFSEGYLEEWGFDGDSECVTASHRG